MRVVILAGERAGAHKDGLAAAHGVAATVCVPLAGVPLLVRVLVAARTAALGPVTCVGPADDVLARAPEVRDWLGDAAWLAPASGPAASVAAALAGDAAWPVLVTTADHGLLTATILRDFAAAAGTSDADVVVGLAPHAAVLARWPDTRRTRLAFADGAWCGCNLFLFRNPAALGVVRFWTTVEQHRKQPWKILAAVGPVTVARYLAGRLPLGEALAALGRLAGCRIGHVVVTHPEAAVDVDSAADHALAERIVAERRAGRASVQVAR